VQGDGAGEIVSFLQVFCSTAKVLAVVVSLAYNINNIANDENVENGVAKR
jgi:hypothetical protein